MIYAFDAGNFKPSREPLNNTYSLETDKSIHIPTTKKKRKRVVKRRVKLNEWH